MNPENPANPLNPLIILFIILLGALALGALAGVLIGKYRLKKERGEIRSILSDRQKIIYLTSIVLGLACIFFAALYDPSASGEQDPGMEEGAFEPGFDENGADMPVDGDMLLGGEGDDTYATDDAGDNQQDADGEGTDEADDAETAETPEAEPNIQTFDDMPAEAAQAEVVQVR